MNKYLIFFISILLVAELNSANPASDGFPSGGDSPEGVAVDLARAFIAADPELFSGACIPPYGGGEAREEYVDFLGGVKASMIEESKKEKRSELGPKEIIRVFKARRLSRDGPASYGYAVFGFDDVQFVDVVVKLYDGRLMQNRTMVIRDGERWFVHPLPHVSPLLSTGLNEESESTVLWKQEDEASNK